MDKSRELLVALAGNEKINSYAIDKAIGFMLEGMQCTSPDEWVLPPDMREGYIRGEMEWFDGMFWLFTLEASPDFTGYTTRPSEIVDARMVKSKAPGIILGYDTDAEMVLKMPIDTITMIDWQPEGSRRVLYVWTSLKNAEVHV